uniref:Uncharacterized protein n=1 Tax=Mustela putorius furo TaxID=9669 RepID=M3Z672_MUSPF
MLISQGHRGRSRSRTVKRPHRASPSPAAARPRLPLEPRAGRSVRGRADMDVGGGASSLGRGQATLPPSSHGGQRGATGRGCRPPREPLTDLVPLLLGDVQVPLAADDGLVKAAQDLQCVAQVPTGLGLPHAVPDGPGGQWGVSSQAPDAESRGDAGQGWGWPGRTGPERTGATLGRGPVLAGEAPSGSPQDGESSWGSLLCGAQPAAVRAWGPPDGDRESRMETGEKGAPGSVTFNMLAGCGGHLGLAGRGRARGHDWWEPRGAPLPLRGPPAADCTCEGGAEGGRQAGGCSGRRAARAKAGGAEGGWGPAGAQAVAPHPLTPPSRHTHSPGGRLTSADTVGRAGPSHAQGPMDRLVPVSRSPSPRGRRPRSPRQQQVVPVVLQGPGVLLQVEVGVAQLAVDGTQRLQVLRAHLHRRLKERRACLEVPRLAETLPLQGELQARGLHPGRRGGKSQPASHAALPGTRASTLPSRGPRGPPTAGPTLHMCVLCPGAGARAGGTPVPQLAHLCTSPRASHCPPTTTRAQGLWVKA